MPRLRDLGIEIGDQPTGPMNALTDVPGVRVGHATVVRDQPTCARTGVTVVVPPTADHGYYAGRFDLNGNGEMTGVHWLDESGLLVGPIGLTNTHQVGLVRDTLVRHAIASNPSARWHLPVVAETYDGHLNDIDSFPLTAADVDTALTDARDGPVVEGSVGGGTGMICHGFKGGIGTSSRRVDIGAGEHMVAALVQANYGRRRHLRLDGDPVGRRITAAVVPLPTDPSTADQGSIIVIVATDAPLVADQCQRLARRATVGLARVGGNGHNGSGDLFLAFSTANAIPLDADAAIAVNTLPAGRLDAIFDAVADCVEESIWNALVAAEDMTGHLGHTAYRIPHDLVRRAD